MTAMIPSFPDYAFVDFINGIDAIVWAMDPKTCQCTFVSQGAERILGYPVQDWYNQPNFLMAYVHPEDQGRMLACQAALTTGAGYCSEFRVLASDSRVVWLRESVSVVRDTQGRAQQFHGVIVDVTEPKRAEAQLRNLASAIEQTADSVGITARDGTIEFVNAAFEKITGFPASEAIGKNPRILKSGVHRPEFYARLWATILAGQAWQGIFVNRKKSGELYFAKTSIAPIFSSQGEITHFVSVEKDITDQKRTEEALRKSEEHYRMLFERNLAGVFRSTLDGRILDCNAAFARMFGCASRQELLSHKAWDFYYSRAERQSILAQLQKDRVLTNLEVCMRRKDGHPVWILENASLLEKEGESSAVIEGTAIDISERKRAEESLRASEEKFRDLVDMLPVAVYVCGASGVIELYNRQAVELWGRQPEPGDTEQRFCLSRGLYELDGTPIPSSEIPVIAVLRTGKPLRNREVVIEQPDRSRLTVMVSVVPSRNAQGKIIGALNCFHDITGYKQLEEQLRQAQKMEAVGQLAGGIAHDFNNLLTIINGYSELLLESSKVGDQQRAQLEEIKKAGDRAVSLTRQLLAFSRRQVLAPQVLDLNAMVVNMQKMLRRLIGEDIQLVIVGQKDLGHVKADPGQIEQVILNLALNARDAMPQGGKLTIEAANDELDEAYARMHVTVTPGSYVMLAVSDTGTGMDAETQAHIFEPFFTTKEKGKGTGLGLATVYGIVKQSGGHIWVYSEPGRGATFKIYFPRVTETADAIAPKKSHSAARGGSETILLAEDDPAVRSLARRILQGNGYHVLEAPDGHQARLLAEGYLGRIHLLLTDVVMPGMSGRELAEDLATFRKEMKVLYMSGYTDNAIVHHGLLDARTPFLQKPFTPDTLAQKVREVLDAPASLGERAA